MTEYERNELIRFIESITFNTPKDGKISWIKYAIDMIKEVIIGKIEDIYNEKEMREIDIHRKSYKELQQTVTDLSLENCLLKKKVEEMKCIPCSEMKPKKGEKYWFYLYGTKEIIYSRWGDGTYDLILWKTGNCFKTKEEAETKGKEIMEKIKKEYEEN